MKHWQNKVAESRQLLPLTLLYGIGVWLLAGLVTQQWWIQFACFLLSVFMMIELSNSNVLIRIYSRSIASLFILLSCAAVFLFPSLTGAISQLCITCSLYTLFRCYQDRQSPGWTFYSFLLIGLGSLTQVEVLSLTPVYWLLMAVGLFSFSLRTFSASLMGILLPYAVMTVVLLVVYGGDFTPLRNHFTIAFTNPDYHAVSMSQMMLFCLLVLLSVTGIIHYLRTSSRDNIRIRQLYYSLMIVNVLATILLGLQPQYYDSMIRVITITCSVLAGHFIALTHTKVTNYAFFIIIGAIFLLTAMNLWIS